MLFAFYMLLIVVVAAGVSALVTSSVLRGRHERLPGVADDTEARLQRLEQAMESLAAEMERMSEGQRFLTRVLTERRVGPGDEGC